MCLRVTGVVRLLLALWFPWYYFHAEDWKNPKAHPRFLCRVKLSSLLIPILIVGSFISVHRPLQCQGACIASEHPSYSALILRRVTFQITIISRRVIMHECSSLKQCCKTNCSFHFLSHSPYLPPIYYGGYDNKPQGSEIRGRPSCASQAPLKIFRGVFEKDPCCFSELVFRRFCAAPCKL